MTRPAGLPAQIATLFERLDKLIELQKERDAKIEKSVTNLDQRMSAYFRVEVGENGARRERDLKDIILDQELRLKKVEGKQKRDDESRIFIRLVRDHPRASAIVSILMLLGIYYAGSEGLFLRLITLLKPL